MDSNAIRQQEADIAQRGRIVFMALFFLIWLLGAGGHSLIGLILCTGMGYAAGQLLSWPFIVQERMNRRRRLRDLEQAEFRELEAHSAALQEQEAAEQLRQTKVDLLTMLANIDQYLRVLAEETEPSRRVIALQSIQKLLSDTLIELEVGDVPADARRDEAVTQAAARTKAEMERLGLSEDRVMNDIERAFARPNDAA